MTSKKEELRLKLHGGENMVGKLFFSMLPVQILILAMGAVNSIVDGAMAGRFIDSSTVGVVGLYYSMINVYNAVGSVLLGGTTVLCGRYMGRGDMEKTEGVFSLNITLTILVSGALTLLSVLIPGPIATTLGATEELKGDLVKYILGFAVGIIPMMMSQQISAFLQLERQSKRGYIGIAGMVISNIALDVLLVAVLKMGVFGLAIATSLSNLIYFLILAPYYLTKKAQLHYHIKKILWKVMGRLIKIGVPGALLVFCLAIRGIVINRILLSYAGNDGLSAMSAFNMISGIFLAYCLGNGSAVRMLTSVFVGEEDKTSIRAVIKTAFTKGLLLSCVVAAIIILISPLLTSIFFPDKESNVYNLAYQLFVIYGFCVPLILIAQVLTNYLQAMGHNLFVNIQSVFDGFFAMVIPALILAPILGALGVWIANPIGIILTILLVPLYNLIYWKRKPRTIDEAMFIKPDFGFAPERTLSLFIHNMDEVSETSEKIHSFCLDNNIDPKSSYYAALCMEEMAGNVIRHGFGNDKKPHSLNMRVVLRDDDIMLRLKDDCVPFDPRTIAELVNDKKSFDNIGIRMVYGLADEVNYQNLLGLNALTITIKEENLSATVTNDYLLERKLRTESPELHQNFRDIVSDLREIVSNSSDFSQTLKDSWELRGLEAIDCCNRLIGPEQIQELNVDEAYILLLSAYLYDMDWSTVEPILSGLKVLTEEQMLAIQKVAGAHEKADLFNEEEYPENIEIPGSNSIRLPYLAAVLRLAEDAIPAKRMTQDAFIIRVESRNSVATKELQETAEKMQKTLDYCREVAEKRSQFSISQKRVVLRILDEE